MRAVSGLDDRFSGCPSDIRDLVVGLSEVEGYREIRCSWNIDINCACNLGCSDCMRFLGELPWIGDSDMTADDARASGKILRRLNVKVSRVRITGGEPTLHHKLHEMVDLLYKEWKLLKRPIVFTNGLIPIKEDPRIGRVRTITQSMKRKPGRHRLYMISPADLGLIPMLGFVRSCEILKACGHHFDSFGFACCFMAVSVGRILGVDVHRPYPTWFGDPEICRHCLLSLPRTVQDVLRICCKKGEIEYPTKTYREGIEREKRKPVKFRRFLDRLAKFEDVDKLLSQ